MGLFPTSRLQAKMSRLNGKSDLFFKSFYSAVCCTLSIDGIIYSMPYDEILYFEVKSREVFMKTVKEVRSFYAPLVTIEKMVPRNFRRFHNSYLINMDYISEMRHSQIRMANGDVISISLPKRSKARAEYINYLNTKGILVNNYK